MTEKLKLTKLDKSFLDFDLNISVIFYPFYEDIIMICGNCFK